MKKLLALVPIVTMGAFLPIAESAAAPPSGSDASAVPVRSVGKATAASKAAQQEQSFRSDAATIAKQTKRSVHDVYADLTWQQEVNQEAQRLSKEYPSTFTGARILSHEKRSVWLGFKGAAPEVTLPSDTAATVAADQPLSAGELSLATADVAKRAKAMFGAESSAAPDIVTGSIDVTVAKPEPSESKNAVGRLRGDAAKTVGSAKLKITFDAKAKDKTEAASGGAKLEVAGTANLHCTSAFSIIRNGVTGMLTAQHCNSSFTHENYNGDVELSTWTVASTLGANGDLRWYNTSTNEVAQFRADHTDLRNLYTAPGFSEGAWMCHFGYGNGKSCDTVYRIGVSSGGVSGLTAMSNHYTTGGNSGGPWFYGGSGYGVHRGYTSIWFKNRAVFTPLSRVMPAFGAYILVN